MAVLCIKAPAIRSTATSSRSSRAYLCTLFPPRRPGSRQRVVRSRAAMAVEAPPQPIVPEAVHWSPVVFGDWPVRSTSCNGGIALAASCVVGAFCTLNFLEFPECSASRAGIKSVAAFFAEVRSPMCSRLMRQS